MSRSSVVALGRAAAGFFLPSRCLACAEGDVEEWLRGGVCRACWDALPPPRDGACCGVCGEVLPSAPQAPICGRCLLDPPAFDRLLAAAPYRGTARRILLAFKFRGADYLGPRLAAAMVTRLPRPEGCAEVAAVPATPRARRARGYHPASILAAAAAAALGLPFRRGLLQKTRETQVQSRVPASRRGANVRGAFRVRSRPAGGVLLIDDVATSGATARECARRLADAGARAVTVWCFARASRLDVDPDVEDDVEPS